LFVVCGVPSRAFADGVVVELGVTQRVPAGPSSSVPGALARVGWASPLSGLDRAVLSLEGGFSGARHVSGWLAASAGLWRGFGGSDVVSAFVGAHVDAGLMRAPGGDSFFLGGRLGLGLVAPTPGARFMMGLWAVANDAGPGLSLTVGCLLPSDR